MLYKKNVGMVERWLRVIAGGAMIVGGFMLFGGAHWAWILAASGVFTIATGAVGFCPACAMVGRREVGAEAK